MLSEEALILFAAAGACVLLILGVLELIAPTRPRRLRRREARRPELRRRGYVSRTPATRAREARAIVEPVRAPVRPAVEDAGPPIEQLLISQAEAVAPRPASPPPAPPPPMQPRPAEPGPKSPIEPARVIEPARAVEPEPTIEPEPAVEPEPALDLEPAVELEAAVESAPPADAALASEPEAWLDEPIEPEPELEVVAAAEPGAPEPEPPPPAPDRRSPVERCYALYEAEQFREVVTQGAIALEAVASGALDMESPDLAKLWGVMGLARRALGDHNGARMAFQEAIAVAPRAHRGAWERHLASLALHVGRQLLSQARSPGATDAEERVSTLYAAITWFDRGVAAAPGDDALHAAAAAARAALWPTYEQVTAELIQRQEYHAARRLLTEALTDVDCPANLQQTFSELLTATHSGEVGQLTAEAIRRMQEGREAEALTTLDRAEELLSTITDDGMPEKRRQELERRLWWGYTKVGIGRLEAGLYEEALEPLLHALDFSSVGAARLDEARRPVVQALEGLVEARGPLIQQLAEDGDRDAALAAGEKLRALLHDAIERGVTRVELIGALVKADEIFERLGEPSA
ncbi:MAG: hypothetical protein AUH81_07245 [Candidatus Rokubacteria bacterium 13_1_40CM_4_69_5]|nr:MAG: hypothetical protein AUH81_07245 [Candidatus Rokubacteria bacterium 13_1_40CM_4_69_5]